MEHERTGKERMVGAASGSAPASFHDHVDDVTFEVRPEWLAGRHWWRIYVAGNPKVLVRHRQFAIQAGKALCADEAQFRRHPHGE